MVMNNHARYFPWRLPKISHKQVELVGNEKSIPNNPCIEVETESGAVMIPLHEDLILSVDPEYQEIIMQIPAGLL